MKWGKYRYVTQGMKQKVETQLKTKENEENAQVMYKPS